MASYLLFKIKKETKKKFRERKRYDPRKNSKKQKMLKKTLLFSAAT